MLILLISAYSFGQISFEKGYYINNSGAKIDCYIKNMDWKNNPTEFQYKLSKNSEKQTATMNTVKSFEIFNGPKYERFFLAIDTSKQDLDDMDTSESPKWENKELFLKVVLGGKVSLYSYVNGNMRKYFIKKDDAEVEQLVYKKYMATNSRIAENTTYKKQLWDMLTCGNLTKKAKNVSYTKNSLLKIIKAYNNCENSKIVNYDERTKIDPWNISIKPGINFAQVEISNSNLVEFDPKFKNQASFQLGVELEYIFGFNRNKWSIVAEPTYVSSYSDEQEVVYFETTSSQLSTNVTITDYSNLEIPLGFRHYSFLSDSSKLFFNAFYMLNIRLDGTTNAERRELLDDDLDPKGNLALGVGFKYKDTFSVEFRYRAPRQLYQTNSIFGTFDYNSFAIIFGYTIF
ncbi:outer membrane beta-barrel protein [Kordia periserrulae]|nr:outer membrane beta-barrel protein [Kordia periserrulae]